MLQWFNYKGADWLVRAVGVAISYEVSSRFDLCLGFLIKTMHLEFGVAWRASYLLFLSMEIICFIPFFFFFLHFLLPSEFFPTEARIKMMSVETSTFFGP